MPSRSEKVGKLAELQAKLARRKALARTPSMQASPRSATPPRSASAAEPVAKGEQQQPCMIGKF